VNPNLCQESWGDCQRLEENLRFPAPAGGWGWQRTDSPLSADW